MRGIGVAVMCRTCGAIPSTPLASSARALRDAEAVLLVDHADAEPGELDRRLDQRVGADDQAQLAAGEPARGPRGGARPGSPRSAARTAIGSSAEQPVEGRPRAARPGSRSAPSAPPGSPLPAPAASRRAATTVLPRPDLAHQQPLHRLAGVEVGVDLVEGRAAGRRSARRAATRASARPARRAARAAAPAAPPGACACASPSSAW